MREPGRGAERDGPSDPEVPGRDPEGRAREEEAGRQVQRQRAQADSNSERQPRGLVEEGLGGQVQMRRWCFFTCPCSD